MKEVKASYAAIVSRISDLEKKKIPINHNDAESIGKRCESFDKFQRKKNLVFFNVPEIGNSDRDKEEISKILREIEVEDTDINVVGRIGIKKDKIRPIKITLEKYNDKLKILSCARNLRGSANFKDIYISPDLTTLQQKEGKKLRDELKLRKNNGETNLGIRGGKVVVLDVSN